MGQINSQIGDQFQQEGVQLSSRQHKEVSHTRHALNQLEGLGPTKLLLTLSSQEVLKLAQILVTQTPDGNATRDLQDGVTSQQIL